MWRELIPDVFSLKDTESKSTLKHLPIPESYEMPDMIPGLAKLELCTSIRQALDQVDLNNRGDNNPQPFSAVLVYPPNNNSYSIGVTCLQINRNKCKCQPTCTLRKSEKGRCKPEVAVIMKRQAYPHQDNEQILVSDLPGYTFISLAPLMPTARIIQAATVVCNSAVDSFASKLLQRTNQYTPIPGDDGTQKKDLNQNWQQLNPSQIQTVCRFVDMQRGCMVVEGPPGTGKTTTIMAMVQSRLELRPVHCH